MLPAQQTVVSGQWQHQCVCLSHTQLCKVQLSCLFFNAIITCKDPESRLPVLVIIIIITTAIIIVIVIVVTTIMLQLMTVPLTDARLQRWQLTHFQTFCRWFKSVAGNEACQRGSMTAGRAKSFWQIWWPSQLFVMGQLFPSQIRCTYMNRTTRTVHCTYVLKFIVRIFNLLYVFNYDSLSDLLIHTNEIKCLFLPLNTLRHKLITIYRKVQLQMHDFILL